MDMEQMNLNTMLMALQASSSGIQEIPQSLPQETPATVNPLGFPINPAILNQLQAQLQLQLNMQLATAAALAQIQRTSPEVKEEETMDVEESQSSFDNQGDIIVPSNDKEGWCRNKKYIERVNGGFQCTVCKKIYGRYNSVSYHVTIYHRNPPIRCDIPGCQFSTREARYIHFHKYYRHGIALPTSIDQGSRRCQYCRHVSKSPAMLEKHMKRHQGLESRMASPMPIKEESPKIKCDILNCGFECDDVATLTEHAEACHFAGRNRGLSFTVNHEGEVEETKPRSTTLC